MNLPEQLFPDEVWKIVTSKELEGVQPWYVISNYGRVYNFKENRFLRITEISNHYSSHFRCIRNGENKDVTAYIQRIMMKLFFPIENCDRLEVDHIDECSFNNMLFNLQWLTREQNISKFYNSYYNRYINQIQKNKGNCGDFYIQYYNTKKYNEPFLINPFIFNPITPSPYEVFIPVRGYEYRYMISNMGRIFDKMNGWFCVTDRIKDQRYIYCYEIKDYIHLAMMKSFCYFSGCEKYSVEFKDGITYNNYLPNLEWSFKEFDPRMTVNTGSNSYLSTLTEEQVRRICELFQEGGYTYREISNIVGIPFSKSILSGIKRRDCWKDISKDYIWKSEKAIRYSEETKQKCIEMLIDGYQQKEIMETLGIQSKDYIYRLKLKLIDQGLVKPYRS